jgi:uncharacterized protein
MIRFARKDETTMGLQLRPNCECGFVTRPTRPAREWRPGVSVAKHPPSNKRVHLSFGLDEIAAHSARISNIPPEDR